VRLSTVQIIKINTYKIRVPCLVANDVRLARFGLRCFFPKYCRNLTYKTHTRGKKTGGENNRWNDKKQTERNKEATDAYMSSVYTSARVLQC